MTEHRDCDEFVAGGRLLRHGAPVGESDCVSMGPAASKEAPSEFRGVICPVPNLRAWRFPP
jgi:hypothetical protein